MDVRHEEFMAMADAFLGPEYDRAKLRQVELLQLELHARQGQLFQALQSRQLNREAFVGESNRLGKDIALQCEAVLGPADFQKLFGASANELNSLIDTGAFLQQA